MVGINAQSKAISESTGGLLSDHSYLPTVKFPQHFYTEPDMHPIPFSPPHHVFLSLISLSAFTSLNKNRYIFRKKGNGKYGIRHIG